MDEHEANLWPLFRRVVFIVVAIARQFLVDARTQAIDLVMSEQTGIDQRAVIEWAARIGGGSEPRRMVDVDRLVVFGGKVRHQHPEPGAAGFRIGREPDRACHAVFSIDAFLRTAASPARASGSPPVSS